MLPCPQDRRVRRIAMELFDLTALELGAKIKKHEIGVVEATRA